MRIKTNWQKITSGMLVAVMSLMLFLNAPGLSFDVLALGSPMTGVYIDGNILKWDAFDGAANYSVSLGTGGGLVTGTSDDLYERAKSYKLESGTYDVSVRACSSSGEYISSSWTGKYVFVSPYTKLSTPTNLKWNGNVATWNAVPNAQTYTVILKTTYEIHRFYNITTNSCDVSDWLKEGTYDYQFIVWAEADNYISSDTAYSPSKSITKSFPPLENVQIEGDVLSWKAFPDATSYDLLIGSGGGYCYGTSVNLSEECQSLGFAAGTYDVKIYAEKKVGSFDIKISSVWSGTYTYTPPKPQLATPTNLKWNGTVATWDAVENATSYDVYIYKASYCIDVRGTTDTSLDLMSFMDEGAHTYKFRVVAKASGYPNSEYATSPDLKTYTVTFDSKGHGTTPATQTVISGTKAEKPSNLSEYGYVFKGWYTDEAFTSEFSFDSSITSNTTLYAKWVPAVFTYTWKPGLGTGSSFSDTYSPDTVITVPAFPSNWTVPSGKHFYRWVINGGSVSANCLPNTSYTVTGNATCTASYANWIVGWEDTGDNGVDLNYGVKDIDGAIAQTGAEMPVIPNSPYMKIDIGLKDGYSLVDNKVEVVNASNNTVITTMTMTLDTTTNIYSGSFSPSAVNADVILRFATKNNNPFYTVTFNMNGNGSAPASQSIQSGNKATKPADPTATGYTFGGWYTNSDCTTAYSFDTAVTANITLYAKWTVVSSGSGSGSGSSTTTPAPTTPAPATPAPTTPAPTPIETPKLTTGIAHVQDIGDVSVAVGSDGVLTIGTTGMGKRLEQITINFENNTPYSGTLQYRVHVQNIGWMEWTDAGQKCGTEGQSLRIEAIEIRFTGELADYYSVEYCVHIQDYGDMQGWVKDGALAGTTGESKRIEELKIRIVPKNSVSSMSVKYRVHVQDYGWEKSYASNGAMSGTSGESKRLEGIELFLSGTQYSGGIKYKTHVQDYGWQGWSYDGEMSGTQGEAKRLEGICIELYGEIAEYYDIYYRVHAQDIGWMAWAKNGECAGTAGRSARLEGIQIVLVPKGEPAPGATYEGITAVTEQAFVEGF